MVYFTYKKTFVSFLTSIAIRACSGVMPRVPTLLSFEWDRAQSIWSSFLLFDFGTSAYYGSPLQSVDGESMVRCGRTCDPYWSNPNFWFTLTKWCVLTIISPPHLCSTNKCRHQRRFPSQHVFSISHFFTSQCSCLRKTQWRVLLPFLRHFLAPPRINEQERCVWSRICSLWAFNGTSQHRWSTSEHNTLT